MDTTLLVTLPTKYRLIDTNRVRILEHWMKKEEIKEIIGFLKLTKDQFMQDFAVQMFEFFLKVVEQENRGGDCPALRNLIAFFHAKKIWPGISSCSAQG